MTSTLVSRIQVDLGFSADQLARLIERAPYTYKVYSIPKRSGGLREIAQPAKETKVLQRWLMSNVFGALPIHECATAYRLGASIRQNAQRHADNTYLSKFDFRNFFPSVLKQDIASHLTSHIGEGLTTAEIEAISRLSCIRPANMTDLCLSVGAPSSPMLSNSVMFEFDSILDEWCRAHKICYTRYADDLAFSTCIKKISSELPTAIQDALATIAYPRLELNSKKTVFVSKKHQRRVTGIVLSNSGSLSLGRDRKREISALVHRFTLRQIAANDVFRLQGLLGFSIDVEPDFLSRLRKKYGSAVIDEILKERKPSASTGEHDKLF